MSECWDCKNDENPNGCFCAKCYNKRIKEAKKQELHNIYKKIDISAPEQSIDMICNYIEKRLKELEK